MQRTADNYAELKKGTFNYHGNIDLQEYTIVRYNMFDSGPNHEWETRVFHQTLYNDIMISVELVLTFRFESHSDAGS